MATGPSIEQSIVSPRTSRSSVPRIRRLASSMSSSLPVSFHQPVTTCGSTRRPRSTMSWMASVISSSPRADGAIDSTLSNTFAVNR